MTSILATAGSVAVIGLAVSLLTSGALTTGAPVAGATTLHGAGGTPAPGAFSAPAGDPVDVSRGFEAPAATWAAGHRGVDLVLPDGAPVRAPADGVVSFSGPVAGRAVVVITHPDGLRSSLEPVVGIVTVGDTVTQGQVVGTLEEAPAHCAPRRCLHWGVRDGDVYLDPMTLLAVHGPVVLLPLGD
jgi:murein DD-endopeptidase MepM/ murein hydrolase activator NlpD